MSNDRAPLFTPTSARDLHRNLAEWYGSREAQRWTASVNDDLPDGTVPHDPPATERARLLAAETFLVTDDMAAVCRQAGMSLPETVAQHDLLPAEFGFIVFNDRAAEHRQHSVVPLQAALWYPSSYSGEAGVCIRAFLWKDTAKAVMYRLRETVEDQHRAEADLQALEAKMVSLGGTVDGPPREPVHPPPTDEDIEEWARKIDRWRFPAMPTYWTFLPYGLEPDEDAMLTREDQYTVRMILAAWILMNQPLAARERPHVDRAAARRATRAGLRSDLTVITLRQPKTTGTGESSREYHQRWVVRGHWRRIPTAEQPSRVTWVHGYVKGPADAPLIVKDRVTVLAR